MGTSRTRHFTAIASSILLVLFFALECTHSETAATRLYNKANQLYEEGNYEEAIAEYERILAAEIKNGYVYYNLGNAYFKSEQLGKAILSFERARRLLPRDEDINANLTFARQFTKDKIETPQPGWIAQFIIGLHNLFSLLEVTVIAWVSYVIVCFTAILYILTRSERLRSIAIHVGAVSLVLFLLTGTSLFVKIRAAESTKLAIVMVPEVNARSGPGDEYTKMFTIHEGTKVRIRQSREGWYLISLPGGTGGWIEGETVERI